LPIIEPFTVINYTLSLSSDPVSGPYSSSINVTVFKTVTIRICQVTVGPQSFGTVSFGDGSPIQTFSTLICTYSPDYCNTISHAYASGGTFTINVTIAPTNADNATIAINTNTITACVDAPFYQSKQNINIHEFTPVHY
jgi:hypothetical protein